MRRVTAVILAVAVSGCTRSAPRLPTGYGPKGPGSTDWSALAALPRGQFIVVTVDGGDTRGSSVWAVSDTAITLWYDVASYTLPRASVTQVVARVQIGEKVERQSIDIGPGGIAEMAGVLGYALWNAHKNRNKKKEPTNWGGLVFVGALALFWDTSVKETKPVYEDRLVYIRP